MDAQARTLLDAQGGVIGSHQLARLGLGPEQPTRWVSSGELARVRRGAFVDGELWRDAHPDGRYRLLVMAVMHSRPTIETATHHSALALHGLPLWHVDRGVVMLSSDVQETTTVSGLRVTPLRGLTEKVNVGGLGALAIPDAVVTTASVNVEAGVVAADAALHTKRCTEADLGDAASRLRRGLRGTARLRRALSLIDGAAESPGESRTRLVLSGLGLPVKSQVVIRQPGGAFVGRVDFLVAGRVIVEFDGAVKYLGEKGPDAVVAEKRREDRLRELGYEVVRLTWQELARPELILARIRAALARCAA
jgi:very-short-patch-repair endonuclease